jgi:sugar O-acyltransferase (sialic acid O-acetyltransferase NeuD family)
MRKLVIFGAGAFAEIAHYYFSHDSDYAVAAFTVDVAYLREATFKGLPVVPFDDVVGHYPPAGHDLFVALGIGQVNRRRAAKVAEVEAKGYRLASFLSSRADVAADLELRPNTMIMERAGIQPFVEIGRDTIVWSATRIGFRSRIGEHCWIVGPILGESVTVGDYSFLGLGATIAPGVSVGKSNIIGAGALIVKDTRDFEVYRGHPSTASRAPSSRLWNK